jgi:hypothetical protein
MSYSACDSDELLVCGKDGLPAPIVCPHRRASGAAPEKRYPRTSGPKDSQGWRAMTNMRIISTDQCLRQACLQAQAWPTVWPLAQAGLPQCCLASLLAERTTQNPFTKVPHSWSQISAGHFFGEGSGACIATLNTSTHPHDCRERRTPNPRPKTHQRTGSQHRRLDRDDLDLAGLLRKHWFKLIDQFLALLPHHSVTQMTEPMAMALQNTGGLAGVPYRLNDFQTAVRI